MQSLPRTNQGPYGATRVVPLKRTRFWLICLFFLIWGTAIGSRLFWLQVVRHKEFLARADKQQLRTFEVAPRRGELYDRNLRELAGTVQADSFYAVPSEIKDKRAAAHALASIVHTDRGDVFTREDQIAARLDNGHSFAWIARRVTPEVAQRIRALSKAGTVKGIFSQKEFQRFYPDNEIAAQVLGYVGSDDVGLGGLEQRFETQMHGVPGQMLTAVDARNHVLGSSEHEPEPGQSFVLTIDEDIQFLAEQALDHAMERTGAANGTVVIQDVHTGQILALAIRPTFDPNTARKTMLSLLKNHAVSDVYEPGSTFKLIAYSAALDQHLVTPDDMIDCQGGQITIAGRVIHDNQGEHLGVVPVHKALEQSSDVAAIKLALKVGQDKYSDYVHNFGFGARTGIELPGETRGLLRPVKKWGPSSIGSIAMGQEVAVTPLQLVSMVSTIANGGTYLPPHILLDGQTGAARAAKPLSPSPFKPGEDLPNPLPPGAHRVISEMAAAQMRKMMEGVVLYGSGHPAALNGYSAGGKTGTAQKIDPATHLYSKTMHIASFVGIAPVNNPVIAVAVVLDNPTKGGSYYGTAVSAPVFKDVAQGVLEYLGVRHDVELQAPKVKAQHEPMVAEDNSVDQGADVNSLFAAVNDLPSDDPLRNPPAQDDPTRAGSNGSTLPAGIVASNKTPAAPNASASHSPATKRANGHEGVPSGGETAQAVTVPSGQKLKGPSLVGLPLRKSVEQAGAAGLAVHLAGPGGTVREQAPAPGTLVAMGTQIVVRCTHQN
jgi:cell division protein FtsI (penicillin-binding protein 3)